MNPTVETKRDLGWVHRFIPAPQDKSPLTLLMLHGTGGNEDSLLDLGRSLLPGAALLSPRGKVLEGGMPRFFRRLAEGVFDVDDLIRRTHELADFVSAASVAYEFDATKVVAVGYSNGANIAASTLLLRPEVLWGAVLLHPMVPLMPDELPSLSNKPIFIGGGRFDPMVPVAETERLADLLRSAGADVTLFFQDNGHSITQDEFAAAQKWLEKASHAF